MFEPILCYYAGIWGTKQFICINSVQNKACTMFLGVGKYTSNISVRGDINWLSCFSKQKIECIRQFSKLVRIHDCNRMIYKRFVLSSRKAKGWFRKVSGFIDTIQAHDIVWDINIPTKVVVKNILQNVNIIDNNVWHCQLFNDHKCLNGNKLRTYRQYKNNISLETCITCNQIPRCHRRLVCQFRSGSLPIAVETVRYTKPPTPLQNRICIYCNISEVENEQHVLIDCHSYSDLRYSLFNLCNNLKSNFKDFSPSDKLNFIMSCNVAEVRQKHGIFYSI